MSEGGNLGKGMKIWVVTGHAQKADDLSRNYVKKLKVITGHAQKADGLGGKCNGDRDGNWACPERPTALMVNIKETKIFYTSVPPLQWVY